MKYSSKIRKAARRAAGTAALALILALPAGAAEAAAPSVVPAPSPSTAADGVQAPVDPAAFTDVPADAWYCDEVAEVVSAGLMSGTSASTFSPDWAVTRGMAVTVLWRLSGAPESAAECTFADVPADTWYSEAAAWAQEQGIAAGNGTGAFRPESAITREELAVLLYQYALSAQSDTAEGVLELYRDGDTVSSWARTAMEHAVGAGLITGSGGALSPRRAATRAELAAVLVRLTTPAMG